MKCPNCKCDLEEVAGPLSHITTIYELFQILEWDLDCDGVVITDSDLLANAIAVTFPTLKNDMPQFVKEVA